MSIKTFKRYENKYLLNQRQYERLMEILPHYMNVDENIQKGEEAYTIYNIYYDTQNDDIIKNSLAKPYYKEKLRMRRYGVPGSDQDEVFLELKKKIGGVVSKRRAAMSLSEAVGFVEKGIKPQKTNYLNGQVTREIEAFLSNHKVAPKVVISYERKAFFGKWDSDFRVTFDSNILTRRNQISFMENVKGQRLLGENQYLMEVKISGAVPLWLAHTLAKHKIYSTGFSKYGEEYKQRRRSHA